MAAQSDDPTSMLALYRTALRLRRTVPDLRRDEFGWRPAPRNVLTFQRGSALQCVANLSQDPVPIGAGVDVLLASGPLTDAAEIPPDTTAWLHTPDHTTQIAQHAVTPVKGL